MRLAFFPKSIVAPKPISKSIQIRFLNRLSNLLKRGYSLQQALNVLEYDPALKSSIDNIKASLLDGAPFEKALTSLGFSRYVVSFLQFAKLEERIEDALLKGGDLLNQQQLYQKKFLKVIRYPLVLFTLFIGLLYFTKQFLLPTFLQLYASMNYDSEQIAHLLRILNTMTTILFFSIPIIMSLVFMMYKLKHKIPLQKRAQLYLSIPLIRSVCIKQTTFLFSYHFSSLLSSGVTIQKSLHLLSTSDHFPLLQLQAKNLHQSLQNGRSFPKSIQICPFLDSDLASLAQQNQSDGKLAQDMMVYSEWILKDTEEKLSKILGWIQPTMFLILATCIMFVYSSIMMPIFEWMNHM